ncbi:MAG: bifunctional 4-hydroxy-2-oxoglutarate aldolase/2-dehydro-3-deoxy-phosphogluconate aldolase [Limnobacter sp.]|nr:bifunctional 4-hydroxy-2-oxoglutarate aldolase/2-dehydro-3-deoxy-phosphogluconate aldolase [Limnobacter sp.]
MSTHPSHPETASNAAHWLCAPILPVVLVHTEAQGLAIAEGLLAGGIAQLEITLRTPAALPAMHAIAREFPTMRLGAGTVLQTPQFAQAADAGATLFISPGLTPLLAEHAQAHGYAWVPGVATAGEFMRALEWGFNTLKFFPAMAAGGPAALAAITQPLPHAQVIPTGGIALDNLAQWKSISAVKACGGTWLTKWPTPTPDMPTLTSAQIAAWVQQKATEALETWQ